MFGVTLTPDDLFKVATGAEVVMDNGVRFKQDRPLDWVSITDHRRRRLRQRPGKPLSPIGMPRLARGQVEAPAVVADHDVKVIR